MGRAKGIRLSCIKKTDKVFKIIKMFATVVLEVSYATIFHQLNVYNVHDILLQLGLVCCLTVKTEVSSVYRLLNDVTDVVCIQSVLLQTVPVLNSIHGVANVFSASS